MQVAREHGFEDKMRVFEYPFDVSRCGPEHLGTPAASVHSLVYFYNWSFAHVETAYSLKWDGDMVLTEDAEGLIHDLAWQLPGKDVIVRVPRHSLYVDNERVAYLDLGLPNVEAYGYPMGPAYTHVKAFEWELRAYPEDVEFVRLPDGASLELKWLDSDEFAHWTAPEAFADNFRTARKRREYELFESLGRGEWERWPHLHRIEAPGGRARDRPRDARVAAARRPRGVLRAPARRPRGEPVVTQGRPEEIGRIPITASIVGVQKAATSTMHTMLTRHRLVAPTFQNDPARAGRKWHFAGKELHFFDDEERDWSAPDYAHYYGSKTQEQQEVAVDATPSYILWPGALERMRAFNPRDAAGGELPRPDRAGVLAVVDGAQAEERLPGVQPGHRGVRRRVDARPGAARGRPVDRAPQEHGDPWSLRSSAGARAGAVPA